MVEMEALWLTVQLSLVVTLLLLLISVPLGWWLARSSSPLRPAIEAFIALPLVLPPTVLGFYLLLALSPDGWLGAIWGRSLAFSFEGLVIGSLIYSLPFVVQPIQSAFSGIGTHTLDAATMLGASRWDRFFTVALPQVIPGILSAAVLGFAHTIGEFGVVLMIGGSIPDETRVLSIAIYERVEALDYAAAHQLSLLLVLSSFVLLFWVYSRGVRFRVLRQ